MRLDNDGNYVLYPGINNRHCRWLDTWNRDNERRNIMNLRIDINLDNDAFTDDPLFEVEWILKQALRLIDFDVEMDNEDVWDLIQESDMHLRDSNGNKVGIAEIK